MASTQLDQARDDGPCYAVDAETILGQLARCGVTDVVTVPDWVQISVHQRLAEGYLPEVNMVLCASEDEALAVAAGLHIGGRVPVVVMQNQGLHACINNLRALGLDAQIPLMLLVGQFGREVSNYGNDPRRSSRRIVAMTEPLLDALQIEYLRLEEPQDADNIGRAFRRSRRGDCPVVVLIGVPTTWGGDADHPEPASRSADA